MAKRSKILNFITNGKGYILNLECGHKITLNNHKAPITGGCFACWKCNKEAKKC